MEDPALLWRATRNDLGMMKTANPKFEANASGSVLLRIHRQYPLCPKALHLGTILLERAPGLVSRSDLQRLLWPEAAPLPTNIDLLVEQLRTAASVAGEPLWIFENDGQLWMELAWISERGEAAPALLQWGDRQFRLWPGLNFIGRDPLCDVLIQHPTVSRRHACLEVAGDRCTIDDLQSRNGTRVDGRVVLAPAVLEPGAIIQLGHLTLAFLVAGIAGVRSL